MTRSRFIVVGPQRSGTSPIAACLAGHSDIEMANSDVRVSQLLGKGLSSFTVGDETYPLRRAGYPPLFDLLASLPARVAGGIRGPVRGLKFALSNVDQAAGLVHAVTEFLPEVKVILIRRNDVVAQFASLLRARSTGRWQATVGDPRSTEEVPLLEIEPDALIAHAREMREIAEVLRLLERSHEVLQLTYERDVLPGIPHSKLFEFVGVAPSPAAPIDMVKGSPPPEQFIRDYRALRRLAAAIETAIDPERLVTEHALAWELEQSMPLLATRAEAAVAAGEPRVALDRALRCLLHSQQPRPEYTRRVFVVIQNALVELDDRSLARTALRALAHTHRQLPEFGWLRALLAHAQGDESTAATWLQRVLDREPDFEPARELLGRLQSAE